MGRITYRSAVDEVAGEMSLNDQLLRPVVKTIVDAFVAYLADQIAVYGETVEVEGLGVFYSTKAYAAEEFASSVRKEITVLRWRPSEDIKRKARERPKFQE